MIVYMLWYSKKNTLLYKEKQQYSPYSCSVLNLHICSKDYQYSTGNNYNASFRLRSKYSRFSSLPVTLWQSSVMLLEEVEVNLQLRPTALKKLLSVHEGE